MNPWLTLWILLLGWERAPVTHLVEIRGMAFRPAELAVAVGDTVAWINHDIVPHTATAEAGTWGTGQLTQGQTGRYAASRAGTARYVCALHPTMTGKLIIRKERS